MTHVNLIHRYLVEEARRLRNKKKVVTVTDYFPGYYFVDSRNVSAIDGLARWEGIRLKWLLSGDKVAVVDLTSVSLPEPVHVVRRWERGAIGKIGAGPMTGLDFIVMNDQVGRNVKVKLISGSFERIVDFKADSLTRVAA